MSNKKAEASDRHNNGFGKTKKLMFNQLNFIKYIEFNKKADAIFAHGSKVLNEEWITKKLSKLHKKYQNLKRGYDKTSLLSYLCSPIASLDMILSFKLKTKALRLRGCGLCTKNIYLTFKRFTNSPFIKALSSNAPFVFFHTI